MLSTRAATVNWLALLGLTAATFVLAENGLAGRALIWPVLAIIFLKGRIVVDRFMGLQGVRGPWRALALGWLALVVGIIGYSLTLSYPAN